MKVNLLPSIVYLRLGGGSSVDCCSPALANSITKDNGGYKLKNAQIHCLLTYLFTNASYCQMDNGYNTNVSLIS